MRTHRRWPKAAGWLAIPALFLILAACAEQARAEPASTPCPPWVASSASEHSNAEAEDLGCTNRRNLEQMVERKHDLVRGRPLGPADAERESLAVKNYEEGKVKEQTTGSASQGVSILTSEPAQGNP